MMTPTQWRIFLDDARRWRCLRRGLIGARVVSVALDLPLPLEVQAELSGDPLAESLARAALLQLHEGRSSGVGAELRSLARMALSEDSALAAAESVLRRLFTPGPGDWVALDLKPAFTALYWPYRPLRLATKYARRLVRA